MAVVTMWVPFSRYISATPLSARLIASVPPEVKTSSLGSRAPISFASLPRAASTAPSASQPNGWLRLAGCPNFSVKYGTIASTTRGSQGVVDCASMKIGNFNGLLRSGLDGEDLGHVLAGQFGQAHGVEHVADGGLDLSDRPPDITPLHLRTAVVLEAAHDPQGTLERPQDLPDSDLARAMGQPVAPLGPVLAHDQPLLGQALEDFRQELGGDAKLVGNALGAHGAPGLVDGDIMNRHQPIIGSLGKPEHFL